MLRYVPLAVACLIATIATHAFAGDHGSHPPMAPPLSVVCSMLPPTQQFDCRHPGYVARIADLRGLSLNIARSSGTAAIRGYRPNGTAILWN